jgi:hypothetical protein
MATSKQGAENLLRVLSYLVMVKSSRLIHWFFGRYIIKCVDNWVICTILTMSFLTIHEYGRSFNHLFSAYVSFFSVLLIPL